jgi:hypothetical protein
VNEKTELPNQGITKRLAIIEMLMGRRIRKIQWSAGRYLEIRYQHSEFDKDNKAKKYGRIYNERGWKIDWPDILDHPDQTGWEVWDFLPDVIDALKDMVAQAKCGCGSPACKTCDRIKDYEKLIEEASGGDHSPSSQATKPQDR